MVRSKDLIEKLGTEYAPMLKKIQITEFTKCVAQLAGLSLNMVSDEAIEEYLTLWCKNKKRFFDLMGGNVRIDIPFSYVDEDRDYEGMIHELGIQYPTYYYWCQKMKRFTTNKITVSKLDWRDKEEFKEMFQDLNVDGMALTRFFKSKLNAPDELVTELGRIYENRKIDAVLTISIDPVDMMLASENPYKWTSCYRLEDGFPESHADGCLASILDTQSLITYIWNNEGKMNLYNNFELKNVRYKRMRMWIALSENMKTIHFNAIYPGKDNYSNDFCKSVRLAIEKWLSNTLGIDDNWGKPKDWNTSAYRENAYGYSEYNSDYLWTHTGDESEDIIVYDRMIVCPCGCGNYLPGTECEDDDGEWGYNGDGMIGENFYPRHYCEYLDDWCDAYSGGDIDECCETCTVWRENNAVCSLDPNHKCYSVWDAEDEGCFDCYGDSLEVRCGGHCQGCQLYEKHCQESLEDDEEAEITINNSDGLTYINNNYPHLVTWEAQRQTITDEDGNPHVFEGGYIVEVKDDGHLMITKNDNNINNAHIGD